MRVRGALFVGLGVSWTILACSGGGDSGGGGTAADSSSFISQYCELLAPCCAKVNRPADGAQCRAFLGAFSGTYQYDAAKGSACLSEVRARQSAPTFCDDPDEGAESCSGVFKENGTGTKQPGEQCSKDGDCASSPEGDVDCASSYSGDAVTKVCQLQLRGKEGETPCAGTRDGSTTSYSSSGNDGPPPARAYICYVSDGLYCGPESKKCERIQQVDGPCTSDDGCVEGTYCNFSTKKCAARLPVGADCGQGGLGSACEDKAYCDSTTKKCTLGLADGAPCARSSECQSRQCVNGKCDASGGGDLGTQLLCGN